MADISASQTDDDKPTKKASKKSEPGVCTHKKCATKKKRAMKVSRKLAVLHRGVRHWPLTWHTPVWIAIHHPTMARRLGMSTA